jgi:hypothetical protein
MRRLAVLVLLPTIAGLAWAAPDRRAEAAGDSPLAKYPGFGHHADADEARFSREEEARERLIAACMRKKGFPYSPSPAVVADDSLTADQAWELVENDPNNRFASSLSRLERVRYHLALAGMPDANNPGSRPVGGCIAAAHQAIPGVYAAFNALREPFEQMQARIASDARVVMAEARWATCMRELGHDFSTPTELKASLDAALTKPRSAAELDALERDYEKALAAGSQCDATTGLGRTVAAATFDHEAAFVNEYRSVLERY